MTKAIIFDASTLISFSMNGLFAEIRKLKEIFNGKFIITDEVKREIIDNPLKSKKFKLEALKMKELLNEKILEMPSSLKVSDEEVSTETKRILKRVNSAFFGGGKHLNIIDSGESSCLALGEILTKKGVRNVLAIDERTTRVLIEKPDNLKELLEKKLHVKIKVKNENFRGFENFKVIRSTELAYVLWKKKLIKLDNGEVLDGLLWALKIRGAAISDSEIKEIKKLR